MTDASPPNPNNDKTRDALLLAIQNGKGWNAREILAFVAGYAQVTADNFLAVTIHDYLNASRLTTVYT